MMLIGRSVQSSLAMAFENWDFWEIIIDICEWFNR